jgi:methylenetetrahydrofolate--tRNA-(uracil-5-)-methyltransferase
MRITVVGGGLAGCEAALYLLKAGYSVELTEMRPQKMTPAHKTGGFAELVCSNSLKSTDPYTAKGLLKAELRLMGCSLLKIAAECAVPAGGALAVDRVQFSEKTGAELAKYTNLTVTRAEAEEIPVLPAIIAAGPLTSGGLLDKLALLTGSGNLFFFDAAAPIISAQSADMSRAFFGGRYGKGGEDYLNCPMTREEYGVFWEALTGAETVKLHGFEGAGVFEGCMPVEVMAKRGRDTLLFGPLRPVGLRTPDGERPHAVVQLRKENAAGEMYNLVGFQTNLTFAEQKRVFSLIPALKDAEFLRYGVMHRNTYLNSPKVLTAAFRLKNSANPLYIGGQLSGTEGYVESIMSGLLAAVALDRELKGLPEAVPPETTVCGALSRYIAAENGAFQPMNANFGLLPPPDAKRKQERGKAYHDRSLSDLTAFIEENRIEPFFP